MSVKAKVEALIYATEEPVTLNQLATLLKDAALAELRAEEESRLALNEVVSDGKPIVEDDEYAEDEQESAPEPVVAAESRPDSFDGSVPSPDDLTQEQKAELDKEDSKRVKEHISGILKELMVEYSDGNRGMEIRQIAGGYRMGTKPEHHDVVVNFAKSLKPLVRLSMQALETLAVIAYKQPVTVPEICEIRGVDSSGVIATLLDRKLITTSGRKQVIGRPILYKTTKEFLLRFGLNNVAELPSMEEFEKLGDPQAGLFEQATADTAPAPNGDAEVSPTAPEAETAGPVPDPQNASE
ncbi:MAG TPA: SMC-Scp complex subunit ScpB [Terriglobales bacterium]